MIINRAVSRPRRAVRVGFVLQLLALAWELTWHVVLNPHADDLGLRHILTTHAPFNAALLLTVCAAAWFAVDLVVKKRLTPSVSLALIGISIEAGGWLWDLVAHASHAHGPGPQVTMLAGAALAIGALLFHDRRGRRSFDHPAAQPP